VRTRPLPSPPSRAWRAGRAVTHSAGGGVSRGAQSSELLALTYGALVAQLVEDYEDPLAINEQLEKMCAAYTRLRCACWPGIARPREGCARRHSRHGE
jgi:hypothetical protein